MLILTWKRLTARPVMTIAIIFGLTVSVALMMSVPLYADAVNFRLLEERLSVQTERNNRPPFAYLYNYIGAWNGPLQQVDIEPVTEYLMGDAGDTLGLPVREAVTHYETGDFRLFPADVPRVTDRKFGIDIFRFATTSDIETHIDIVDGAWPAVSRSGGPLEVLVRDSAAESLGLTVGTEYITYDLRSPLGKPITFPVRLAGTWRPIDPDDAFWLYAPDSYSDRMLVPLETWTGRIAGTLTDEIFLAAWYLVLDGDRVTTTDVDRLLSGASRVESEAADLLAETGPLQSPADALAGYLRDARALTFQLLAFNVPTIALAFAFTGLVIGLVIDDRRNETAIMRSRGEPVRMILLRFLLEGGVIGLISLILGSGLAWAFTRGMGQVRSFLDFSAGTQLRVLFVPLAWWVGLATVLLFLFTAVWPMRGAAQFTIVSYRASQARERLKPWWQRSFLDVILLGLAAVGTWQLQQQSGLVSERGGIFDNPLLFLLPALVILASILIFLRILPILMEGLSRLLTLSNSIGLLQATRNLSRTTSFFTTPFILLAVTVSLSIYTASLARTMDFQLFDQTWYEIGADLNLFTSPNPFGDESRFGFVSQGDNAADTYVFLPVSEYENVDGVQQATRIGRFPAQFSGQDGEFVGIDYSTFPQVAYWREDFSRYRISTLMNGLALHEDGVLVSEQFLAANSLQAGDRLEMRVQLEDGFVTLNPVIAGSFDLFPTWFPAEDEEIIVGRLDYLFEQVGSEFPYRLWITTDGQLDDERLRTDLLDRQIIGSTWREPFSIVQSEQIEPARQGLFGLLSIGFVAAVLLTVVGFFLYMFFSFRRRTVELGVLRSVGLPFPTMIRLLGWELALLMGSGLAWGSLMGIVVSYLFIPYLQVGRDPADLVPPYLVEIAWNSVWQVYALFALLFVVVLGAVSTLLSRMKLFQAIKLGETV